MAEYTEHLKDTAGNVVETRSLEAPQSRPGVSQRTLRVRALHAGFASGPATPTSHGTYTAGRCAPSGVCSMRGETQSDRGKPKWKSTLTLERGTESWNAAWTVRYIHAMSERCSDFLDGTPDSLTNLALCSTPDHDDNSASRNRLSSTMLHDVQASYSLPVGGGDSTVTVGVNNLLDRDPPVSLSASISGYDASVYDIPGGRFPYFRLTYSNDR